MEMKKQLVFHTIVVSLILSVIYGIIFSSANGFLVSSSEHSDSGWFTVFVAFFLLLYLFHIVLSFIGYAAGNLAKANLIKMLTLFIFMGLLIIVGVCLVFKEWRLLTLCFSLVIFSVSFWIKKERTGT